MTIDEKLGKTLEELGTTEQRGATLLFEEVRRTLEAECRAIQGTESDVLFRLQQKDLHDRWLGRKRGLITVKIKTNWLDTAPKQLKPVVGHLFNELRSAALTQIEEQLPKTRASIITAVEAFRRPTDLTLPGYRRPIGSIHPITRVQREIEDIFLSLGFWIETGPEIESVYYNFDALNIPESHPSRDDVDTLYIDSKTLLRTHTSPVQIRAMEKYGAPLYIIVPGKCYRRDNPDATHSPMFHQIEGLAVDTGITFADLKGTLDFFARKFFGEQVRTSFRPTYFPFTEPSGEVAVSCIACGGEGCRVCKHSGWIEVMGCGMVHPQVLRNARIDPERYSGWAFGLGIDRFAMVKYDLSDIQLFFQSDLRFLGQF